MISIGPWWATASATTWLLVMKWPDRSSTKPEPVAPSFLPWYCANTCTVLGSTCCATEATEWLLAGSGAWETVPAAPRPPLTCPSREEVCQFSYAAPPTTPPTTPTNRARTDTTGHSQPGTPPRETGACGWTARRCVGPGAGKGRPEDTTS